MKYTFEKFKLNEKILKSLKSLGYNIPSRVQREVIPKLLKGQNFIVGQNRKWKDSKFCNTFMRI